MDNLTYREKQILRFLTDGLSNQEMADKLCTSRKSVESSLQWLFQKTGCSNRVKLALFAERSDIFKTQKVA